MHVTTNKGKKLVLMSLADKIRANEIMTAHLHPVEGTNKFRYDEGWSDAKIAETIGHNLGAQHIYKVRMSLFEALNNPLPIGMNTGSRLGGVEDATKRLQDQQELLAVRVLEIVDAFDRLIDLLKMNHVVDARAIKIKRN
jgi:hypothetical protein